MSDPMLDPITMRADWAEPDGVLANYVSLTDQLVEHVDPGTPFTLTVGGLVVDGELIPQWQWFAELSELNDHEDAYYVGMAEYVKELSDLAHTAVKKRDIGEEISFRQYQALSVPTRYIHLRDARISRPGQATGVTGRLWRGRLRDVSGWTPGRADA
ncbi:hypothetical protein [Actinoplanes sp. DH11]|uniref:hypothetical protein n=1 Tax=Actinoplanes sp. DH11 TaxID=2857011 RepID=UPI001E29EA81|nr:hypothetical protein [Actinoplanes sp. DH11]